MESASPSQTNQILERLYKTALEQEQPLPFFKGLNAYTEYVLKSSRLKAVVDKHISEQEERHKKMENAEEKALKEMHQSKNKLLKIIKKNSIDTSGFTHYQTHAFKQGGILSDLEALEKGELRRAGHQSDALEDYLFDISANLLSLGYEKELKDFIVTKEEYRDYYRRINGKDTYWSMYGNTNGNFIFSKTWPERYEQKALLDLERNLKPWGSFEKIIQFKRAYDGALSNTVSWEIDNSKGVYPGTLRIPEVIDTIHMAEELYHLMGKSEHHVLRSDKLIVTDFKDILRTIHNVFLQTTDDEQPPVEMKKEGISKITFVERKTLSNPVFSFYINDNPKDLKKLRNDSARIRKLVKVIRRENEPFDKNLLDYINSNKDCVLYCRGKYGLTKIVEQDGKQLRVRPEIKTEVITEVAYKKRLNKKA